MCTAKFMGGAHIATCPCVCAIAQMAGTPGGRCAAVQEQGHTSTHALAPRAIHGARAMEGGGGEGAPACAEAGEIYQKKRFRHRAVAHLEHMNESNRALLCPALEHMNGRCTGICIKLMRGGKGQGRKAKLAATENVQCRTNGLDQGACCSWPDWP